MFRTTQNIFWKFLLPGVFAFLFICFLLRLKEDVFPGKKYAGKPAQLKEDEFDPSLLRLDDMAKLEIFCDSLYESQKATRTYPGIVSEVIRKKFYHGYSYYNAFTNPTALFASSAIAPYMAAIVIPDDIVKYPYAACSQQSLVGMELFKRKGYPVRKIAMFDTLTQYGHFAYEVFYDNKWHYYDTNLEPDVAVLKRYDRPSVSFLKSHPEIIAMAYRDRDTAFLQRLLLSGEPGPVNINPAPTATLFQSYSMYMNYFGWLLPGILLLARYWIIRRRISFSVIRRLARYAIPAVETRRESPQEARA
ncbi:MAG: hypothetical protein JNK14_10960 [Chitinophagaceae bacterium]|nr:hypothetical protein [Chitinophagaceae bacterium]